MLVYIHCAKTSGIDALDVTVEVDVTSGVGIHLVGLADTAVRESLLRTVTALQSKGFRIPGRKIVINLAPADLQKSGSGYDLPIALGIIAASGQKELPLLENYLIMGELGLDGSIRYIPGSLPIVELASDRGMKGCILPESSAKEATGFKDIDLYGVNDLDEVLSILAGEPVLSPVVTAGAANGEIEGKAPDIMDFADIVGQEGAKRGLEIAAAGGHNAILIGPQGSGKSSLAKALSGILPPMSREESVITSKIYSVAGRRVSSSGLITQRPFRAPHNSASMAAMLGGGSGDNLLPGEVSLASGGILFLDEFAQTPSSILDALRAPLEDRKVTLSRLKSKITYPASFMLVAASNPCPCGYWGDGDRCQCTPSQRLRYIQRLSGPLIDRIDIQLFVPSVKANALVDAEKTRAGRETSAAVALRVAAAREIQKRRFSGEGIFSNAEMNHEHIRRWCPLQDECSDMLEKLITRLGLSARAYARVLKIARTIADLEAVSQAPAGGDGILPEPGPIEPRHLAEAVSFRILDRCGEYSI